MGDLLVESASGSVVSLPLLRGTCILRGPTHLRGTCSVLEYAE